MESVLAEEVEGALGRAQVDQQEDQQDDGQQRNEQVPAGRQDVVPLGLVGALLGQLQVAPGRLVPGLNTQTNTLMSSRHRRGQWC